MVFSGRPMPLMSFAPSTSRLRHRRGLLGVRYMVILTLVAILLHKMKNLNKQFNVSNPLLACYNLKETRGVTFLCQQLTVTFSYFQFLSQQGEYSRIFSSSFVVCKSHFLFFKTTYDRCPLTQLLARSFN